MAKVVYAVDALPGERRQASMLRRGAESARESNIAGVGLHDDPAVWAGRDQGVQDMYPAAAGLKGRAAVRRPGGPQAGPEALRTEDPRHEQGVVHMLDALHKR